MDEIERVLGGRTRGNRNEPSDGAPEWEFTVKQSDEVNEVQKSQKSQKSVLSERSATPPTERR